MSTCNTGSSIAALATIKRGDTARALTDTLELDGAPVDLTGASVVLVWRAGATTARKTASIVTAAEGTVSYVPLAADVEESGDIYLEWEVTLSGGGVLSFPGTGFIVLRVVDDLG